MHCHASADVKHLPSSNGFQALALDRWPGRLLCLLDMGEDALISIAFAARNKLERWSFLCAVSLVCKDYRRAMRPWMGLVARQAARQLVSRLENHLSCDRQLLNLSSIGWIGDKEVGLLAHAIAIGRLREVRVVWLQNNQIGPTGLDALASYLARNPGKVASISLGNNAFSPCLRERNVPACLGRAISHLEAVARRRGLRVSLNS